MLPLKQSYFTFQEKNQVPLLYNLNKNSIFFNSLESLFDVSNSIYNAK